MNFRTFLVSPLFMWIVLFAILSLMLTWPARTARSWVTFALWLLVLISLIIQLILR